MFITITTTGVTALVTLVVTVVLELGDKMLIDKPQKLPLEMAELQKVLEAKSKKDVESPELCQAPMFVASYNDSTLKGKFFLNYVSNLKLSILLDSESIEKEEKFELLAGYMNAVNVTEIYNLNDVVAVMLLEEKGAEAETEELWLSKEERDEFREQNKDLIQTWVRFLDSILIGLPFCMEEYSKTIGKELLDNNAVELIGDANAIGKNVSLLISTPDYLEFYLSLPVNTQPAFYEAQWFEPVFSGHSMLSIMKDKGTLFPFMVGFAESWFSEDELKEMVGLTAA
jgi:hypothetical protein